MQSHLVRHLLYSRWRDHIPTGLFLCWTPCWGGSPWLRTLLPSEVQFGPWWAATCERCEALLIRKHSASSRNTCITWSLWGSWRTRWCRESCTWWGRSRVAEPWKRSPVWHRQPLGSAAFQRNLDDGWTGAMSRRERASQQPTVRFHTGCCHSPWRCFCPSAERNRN